jgi:uncharacterized protein YecE (DUF72 family)
MGTIRIGISGWRYEGWRGDFYPEGLRQKDELSYAAGQMDTIEINGSFYSLQSPDSYARWHDETPSGFRFALKGSRYITHMKRLGDAEEALARFFASGVLLLRDKLGPVLWQLPANFNFDEARLDRFFELLPSDTESAAALARSADLAPSKRHDKTDRNRRIRHVIEVRNESFFVPEFVRLLRRHNVGLVISDAPDWPLREELTAGLVYVRLHGARNLYESRYTDAELDHWAERATAWREGGDVGDAERITGRKPPPRRGRDVWIYFDNDAKVHAPRDALRLKERVADRSRAGR